MSVVRRWLPPVAFIGIPSALILPFFFSGQMLYGSDVISVFYYSRILIADAFRSGRLPTWDPHTMAGFPLLAGVQAGVFYPPSWLCVFLSAESFWTLSVWAHLVLAGFFANRWLERGVEVGPRAALVGAILYSLSGYLAYRVFAGHVNYVWAYPWMAGLLWRFERYQSAPTLRRGMLLAMAFAMMVFAGVPQYLLFAAVILGARLAQRFFRDSRRGFEGIRSVAWLGLGLLLSAPQLLPTLELVSQMQRGHSEDRAFYESNAMDRSTLTTIFLGHTVGEVTAHVGGAAILLAGIALVRRREQTLLWAGLSSFGILMSFGPATPLYAVFTTLVPGSGQFREPGRYLLLFTVGITALAALGFDALWSRETRVHRGIAAALALATVAQLVVMNHSFFQGWDPRSTQWRPEWNRYLQERCGKEYRTATAGTSAGILDVGRCSQIGVDHVGGYDPMMLRRYAELINAVRGAPLGANMPLLAAEAPHPVMDMLGAKIWHFASGKPDASWPRWRRTEFYENPDAIPRTWLVNNAVVLESPEERLTRMAKGPWDPRKTVILESLPDEAPPVPTEAPAGRSTVLVRRPGYYEIEAQNDALAYLVLSEAYYPGWSAEVDGQGADVLPANHLLQSVRLPAGKHVVRFQYRSRFLALGFAVAALAALVPVGLLVLRHRRQLALQRLPGAP